MKLTGKFCRSRTASFADLKRNIFPPNNMQLNNNQRTKKQFDQKSFKGTRDGFSQAGERRRSADRKLASLSKSLAYWKKTHVQEVSWLPFRNFLCVSRKGVRQAMAQKGKSKTVKAGSKTYFFDIKQSKEEKSFLVITESRFKDQGSERERHSILVFPEQADEFAKALTEMLKHIQ